MTFTDQAIEAATNAIINSRDLCGNEKSAALEALADEGIKGADALKAFRIANFRANARWNGFKRQAGVSEKHIF